MAYADSKCVALFDNDSCGKLLVDLEWDNTDKRCEFKTGATDKDAKCRTIGYKNNGDIYCEKVATANCGTDF